MKKLISYLISLILSSSSLLADKERITSEAELFTTRVPIQFDAAIERAEKIGIHKQVILEATFLYYVDTENYKGIASLHNKFQQHLKKFDLDKSKIFATKEQWQSVIEYSLALQALEKDDQKKFKQHITEAYWLSPETASAFSHHITIDRNKKLMQKIIISPDRELLSLEENKPVTFKELIKDNDALILRFWSPWNQQLDTTYPLTESVAKQCQGTKIIFTSVLLGNDQQLITSAKELIAEQSSPLPSLWLIDSNKKSFSKQLRISDLPTHVIITKEGKIAFHGNVSNNSFWNTLTKLDSTIKKPNKK